MLNCLFSPLFFRTERWAGDSQRKGQLAKEKNYGSSFFAFKGVNKVIKTKKRAKPNRSKQNNYFS